MRSLSLAALVLASALPGRAHAWCQTLTVQDAVRPRAEGTCLTVADFSAEEIESMSVAPLAWRQPCVTWVLHPDGTPDVPRDVVVGEIERAFETWTGTLCDGDTIGFQVSQQEVPDLRCAFREHLPDAPNVSVIVFAQDWGARLNSPAAHAVTSTWFHRRTGEIFGADVELNDERRTWAVCPDEGCDDGRVDLHNVLAHEVGHAFGFSHTDADELATMWPMSDAGDVHMRDLTPDDEAGWCAVYPAAPTAACRDESEPPLDCRFIGDACDPMRPRLTCGSGYCEDVGGGTFQCTQPCAVDDATSCPEASECRELSDGARRCVPTGCGCRVGARDRGAWLAPLLVLLALVARRRLR